MLDFDLTNYKEHPTQKNYLVYRFYKEEQADYFEQLLKEKNVYFEKDKEESSPPVFYYGVKKNDYEKVSNINNMAIGKFRKPFIPDKWFRYLVLIITIGMILLGIVGSLLKKS